MSASVSDLNLRRPDLFLDLREERSGVLFRHAPGAALLHEVSNWVGSRPLAKLRSTRDKNRHDSPVSRKKARRGAGPSLPRKKALMPSAARMPQANPRHQLPNGRRCQPAPLRVTRPAGSCAWLGPSGLGATASVEDASEL